jgi:nitrogen-specific signal transduction histidine kinase
MFNPFVTTKKSGVGLGLSIVSKIIDGHHGVIRVENANRRPADATPPDATQAAGACFVIFLPAATETSTPTTSEHLVIS